jgi:hypothetical protein
MLVDVGVAHPRRTRHIDNINLARPMSSKQVLCRGEDALTRLRG